METNHNQPNQTCDSFVCPKHHKPLTQSKFQEKHCYCPTKDDNGAYCSYKCWKDSGNAVERNWQSPIRNGSQEKPKELYASGDALQDINNKLDEILAELKDLRSNY